MIIVETQGRKLGVSFMHPVIEGAKKRQPKRKTICQIYEQVDRTEHFPGVWELRITAEAPCSRDDNFQKSVGRKLALKRALCQHDFGFKDTVVCKKCDSQLTTFLVLPKEARSAVWSVFKEKTRGPHSTKTEVSPNQQTPAQA